LIPKHRGKNVCSTLLPRKFWGWVSRYAATTLNFALSVGHSDITRFHPRLPVATRNHLDRNKRKKFQKFLRHLATLTFFVQVQAFRDPLRGDLLHVQIFMTVAPKPLNLDAQSLSH
jgi:hypothetical protein